LTGTNTYFTQFCDTVADCGAILASFSLKRGLGVRALTTPLALACIEPPLSITALIRTYTLPRLVFALLHRQLQTTCVV
jgi:hypothetical protein